MKQGNLDGSYGTFMWRGAIVLMLLTALVLFSSCTLRGGHNGAASQPGQQAAGQQSGAGQNNGSKSAAQQIQDADQQIQNSMQSIDNTQNDANNANTQTGQENDFVP